MTIRNRIYETLYLVVSIWSKSRALCRYSENGIIILDDEQIGKDTIKMHVTLPQDNYIKAGSINTRYWVLGEGE